MTQEQQQSAFLEPQKAAVPSFLEPKNATAAAIAAAHVRYGSAVHTTTDSYRKTDREEEEGKRSLLWALLNEERDYRLSVSA